MGWWREMLGEWDGWMDLGMRYVLQHTCQNYSLSVCEAPSVWCWSLLLEGVLYIYIYCSCYIEVTWIYEWRIITVITHGRIMSDLGLTWVLLPLNCKEISGYPFFGDHRRILDAVPHARCWLFILSNEALAADFGFIWVIKPGSPGEPHRAPFPMVEVGCCCPDGHVSWRKVHSSIQETEK